MPSAREIRHQLLQAESVRLKAREDAILAVIGAANQWKKSVAKATETERTLHALTAAATEHLSADELAAFGGMPAKDVRSWARSGAGLSTEAARTTTGGKHGRKTTPTTTGTSRSAPRTPTPATPATPPATTPDTPH